MKVPQQRRVLCVRILITLAIITLFGGSQNALAQQWTTNGNDISNTNSGNVGVGTTTPDVNAKLHVFKPLGAGVDIQSPNTGGWSRVRLVTGTRTYGWFAGDAGNSDAPNKIGLYDYNALAFRMMIDSSGNVGIGSTSPLGQLQLGYTAQVAAPKTWTASASNGRGLVIDSYQENANPYKQYVDFAAMGDSNATQGGSVMRFLTNPVNSYTLVERLRIDNAGNVGIGTIPSTKLHVSSGTDASTSLLRLETGIHGGTNFVIGGTANNESFMDMSVYRGGQYVSRFGVTNFGQVYFQPSDSNVGIGTTNPDSNYKLDVVGNVRVSGNIAAKYQDVSEWVPAARALAPGTVVTLNPSQSNLVEASSKAYDTRVAGVISAQPGITLGEQSENKVLVATTGRVKVRVDATSAPIHIGDLLVTSDTPGMAMKSEPITMRGRQIHAPGTLIGKALEPLEKGRGEILVLLSLQ